MFAQIIENDIDVLVDHQNESNYHDIDPFNFAQTVDDVDVVDIQADMAHHAQKIKADESKCTYFDSYDANPEDSDYMIYSAKVSSACDKNSVYFLEFTDTVENWEKTTFACSNVYMSGYASTDGKYITKKFALAGNAGVDSVSFYRPKGMVSPAHTGDKYHVN